MQDSLPDQGIHEGEVPRREPWELERGRRCTDCGTVEHELCEAGERLLCLSCFLREDKKEKEEEKDEGNGKGNVHCLPRRELPPTCSLREQVEIILEDVLDEESDLYTLLEAC